MYNALRMYQDADVFRRDIKQPAGLNNLKPLIHKCGGINRNLFSHAPVRMFQRLTGCNVLKFIPPFTHKRPARGGEDYSPDISPFVPLYTLKNRAMLAVDRYDLHTPFPGL